MVELQDEFGPAATAVDTVLCSLAKEQNSCGAIREGFARIAREAGMAGMSDEVRQVMVRASEIGWLDDLTIDDDGRRFRCRVSGWVADQDKARAAWRQQKKRSEQAESTVTDRDTSRSVTESHIDRTGQDSKDTVEPARLDEARDRIQSEQVQRVFDEWVTATSRTGRTVLDAKRRRRITNALKTYPLDDVLAAVRGWKNSPHHRGENQAGTVYNDLDLLLRDGEHIERFRDLDAQVAGAVAPLESPAERSARFNARYGDSAA